MEEIEFLNWLKKLGVVMVFGFCFIAASCFAQEGSKLQSQSVSVAGVRILKGNNFNRIDTCVVGYKFAVQQPVTVTHLGICDQNGDGILNGPQEPEVGLWDMTGKLLVSAKIPLNVKLDEGAFYVTTAPLELSPASYVIGALNYRDGERFWYDSNIKTAPGVTWQEGRYVFSDKLIFPPSQRFEGAAYFGPVFKLKSNVEFTLTKPAEWTVFQRDKNNRCKVPLEGVFLNSADRFETRAIDLQSSKPVTQWMPVPLEKGVFVSQLDLPAGWYRIEIRVLRNGNEVYSRVIQPIGVGEVFLTAGQSNSANYGSPPQKAQDQRLSACDFATGLWRHADDPQPGATGEGGSPWPLLGDFLVKKYNVPVGFISVGVGGTSLAQWQPSNQYYARIKKALEIAGPNGLRAILWHQGESDSLAKTSSETYASLLKTIIEQSRKDAGFDVPWGVALVSYHPSSNGKDQSQIVAGQKKIIQEVSLVFAGPATDSYHLKNFLSDGVHFNSQGLYAHAAGWAEAVAPLIETKTVSATTPGKQ